MALSITERWESGEGSVGSNSGDIYSAIVKGSKDDNADDAYTVTVYAATHFSPVSPQGNIINNLARKRIAPYTWEFTATYSSPTWERQTNDAQFSFTTGGGTQHITTSRETIGKFVVTGGTPIDFQNGIGVSGTGEVEGVDIHVSSFDFKTTFYAPQNLLTTNYVGSMKNLTDCANSDTVNLNIDGIQITFQPGELLYLGAEGQKRKGFSDWELTLNWSGQKNVSNATIGPITGITKRGWDYLWVYYEVAKQDNHLPPLPIQVNVERVYDYQALSPLLLPTQFGLTNSQPWTQPTFINGTQTGS